MSLPQRVSRASNSAHGIGAAMGGQGFAQAPVVAKPFTASALLDGAAMLFGVK